MRLEGQRQNAGAIGRCDYGRPWLRLAPKLHLNLSNVGFDRQFGNDKLVALTIESGPQLNGSNDVSQISKNPDSFQRDLSRRSRMLRAS